MANSLYRKKSSLQERMHALNVNFASMGYNSGNPMKVIAPVKGDPIDFEAL